MSLLSQDSRFKPDRQDTREDYSGARPGAFSKSLSRSGSSAVGGMGGTSARTTVFDSAASKEPTPSIGAYDTREKTGAFANVAPKGSGSVSAAFASKSGRFDRTTAPASTATTAYDVNYNTIGAAANRSKAAASRKGGFGSSVSRDTMTWNPGKDAGKDAGEGAESGANDYTPVPSSFGVSKSFHKGPSAAFGGAKDRFAPVKAATPGPGEYEDVDRKPLAPFNKSGANGVLRSTMGLGERFKATKEDARVDYSAARPGAFASKSVSSSKAANTGFGGTSSRSSVFADAAAAAAKNPSSQLGPYDNALTGAFASVTQKSGPSAGFASKSARLPTEKVEGPAPGAYNAHALGSIASAASKSFSKSVLAGSGGFGTGVRGRGEGTFGRPKQDEDAPGPGAYDASAPTDATKSAKPSAAFASKSARLATLRPSSAPQATDYDPHANDGLAATATRTFNKKAEAMGGTADRFAPTREAIQADYSDAREGAFSKSKSASSAPNTGFGGTSKRETFLPAASEAPDSYYVGPGAFAKANESATAPSAAFSSRSERLHTPKGSDAPAPGAYNAHALGSMASAAAKSFNKSAAAGSGGFGTAVRRPEAFLRTPAETPGPGAYEALEVKPSDAKPSAAFASKSAKLAELRQTSAPQSTDYDPHANDGMGQVKSFNARVGKSGSGFGQKAARQLHQTKATPAPGEYDAIDPTKQTVDQSSAKGRVTGAFASTTLRDTGAWGVP
jgi:hypothetical protein